MLATLIKIEMRMRRVFLLHLRLAWIDADIGERFLLYDKILKMHFFIYKCDIVSVKILKLFSAKYFLHHWRFKT